MVSNRPSATTTQAVVNKVKSPKARKRRNGEGAAEGISVTLPDTINTFGPSAVFSLYEEIIITKKWSHLNRFIQHVYTLT